MAKEIIHRSETDLVVERWLAGKRFTLKDVTDYRIERKAGEPGKITIGLFFDDKPATAGEE